MAQRNLNYSVFLKKKKTIQIDPLAINIQLWKNYTVDAAEILVWNLIAYGMHGEVLSRQ